MTPEQTIEREIDKCFAELDEQHTIASFIGDVELSELEERARSYYADNHGAAKHSPVAMMYTLLLYKVSDIKSRRATIRFLRKHPEIAKALGHNMQHGVPSPQVLSSFVNTKLDERAKELLDYAVDYIEERNRTAEYPIRELQDDDEDADERSEEEREKERVFQQVSQTLRWHVFPAINFPRADNAKYEDIEILDLLVFTGMRNVCTNEGYQLMSEIVGKDIPNARTVRHHIAELDRNRIYEMYEKANKRLLEKAKEKGRLGEQPVDVAIDFTNIQYYGDKNDEMVKEVKPKDGTSHAYQFATIKVVSGNEHYTLKALPVSKFSDKADIVEELLEAAQQHVDIRRLYCDRGFFSVNIINLLQNRGVKFIMPAIKNSRIKDIVAETDDQSFQRYTMQNSDRDTTTFNLVIKTPPNDDDPKPFATNCNKLECLTNNLFDLYGRRWDIESGYRVQKQNFYPKTTSKDYNIRLFYFLFSQLLYNAWTLTNTATSIQLYGEAGEEKILTAQEFLYKLITEYIDYG